MTEERMICKLYRIGTSIGMGPELKWVPIEPAPPKDWIPMCYTYDEKNNTCIWAEPNILPTHMDKRCKVCPYRKME